MTENWSTSATQPAGAPGQRATGASGLHAELCELVPLIPAGRVLTYGDLAHDLGTGPRQVGRAMAGLGEHNANGATVPWWRVVNARGELPPDLWARALPEYEREGTPLHADGHRVAMRHARWGGAGD